VGPDYWLTVGGGFDPSDTPVIDPKTNTKTATLEPNYAAFFDRNGSLLVSFISKGGSNNGATLNFYPGALRGHNDLPGFWLQQIRGGGLRFGLVSRAGIGLSTFRR